MASRIRVGVFKRANRKYFQIQWRDPASGKMETKSAGTASRVRAVAAGRKIQRQLKAGLLRDPALTTWRQLREQYEANVFPRHTLKTRLKMLGVMKAVERIIRPKLVSDIDTLQILYFTRELRAKCLSEFTVRGHLAELRKVLRWGKRVGFVAHLPEIDMPKRLHSMKGRPITPEEFELMIAAVPQVVAPERTAATMQRMTKGERSEYESRRLKAIDSWRFLLQGLWWSGLRLGEAVALTWDRSDFCVDLSGDYPMFHISACAEKGKKDRILPIAPEFADLLARVPMAERQGFVFDPQPIERRGRARMDWVVRIICRIGKAAGIEVAERKRLVGRKEQTVVKYASAHDLRRAFGVRWAMRVLPPVLMEMMRHESIETTMKFYVGRQAEVAARAAWEAIGQSWSPETAVQSEELARKAA